MPDHMKFVVDKETVGQVSSDYFGFPPMLHDYLHLQVAVTRGTKWRRLGTF
jgi:hypothetical protein